MWKIGVQTKNVINDEYPRDGFELLRRTGFSYCDFSLNRYLLNTELYAGNRNRFFDQSVEELKEYFRPHKEGAKEAGIRINQMHMPYPMYIPDGNIELNDYLWGQVAPKSMEICHFLECPYIVVHGFKLVRFLGSEEAEWAKTAKFLEYLAPFAREAGITICMENLYNVLGGHMTEGPGCDAKKAAERIDRMNDKYGAEILGFCFDTGHANLVGIDPEHFIRTLGNRLKVLHIHDNDGISDLHQIPFTFTRTRENTSSTNWEGFLRGLAAVRFDGVFSFETAPVLDSFPIGMREDALRFIARIGEYFSDRFDGL